MAQRLLIVSLILLGLISVIQGAALAQTTPTPTPTPTPTATPTATPVFGPAGLPNTWPTPTVLPTAPGTNPPNLLGDFDIMVELVEMAETGVSWWQRMADLATIIQTIILLVIITGGLYSIGQKIQDL